METNNYFTEANQLFKKIIDYLEDIPEGIEDLVFNEEIIQFEISNESYRTVNREIEGQERGGNLKFIINKHSVLKEIWLASPISGPLHFKYDKERNTWLDREKVEIFAVLREDLKILKILV